MNIPRHVEAELKKVTLGEVIDHFKKLYETEDIRISELQGKIISIWADGKIRQEYNNRMDLLKSILF